MKRIVIALVLIAVPAFAADPATDAEPVDIAIRRALDFLAKAQSPEGYWRLNGFGAAKSPGVTGLCTMAFLSAGHTPTAGRYSPQVAAGIRWVLKQQNADGAIATGDQYQMYHHGICTLMLAEVVGMCESPLDRQVRDALVKAVNVILRSQHRVGEHRGGWRYTVNDPTADLSITGWQLLALRAARNVGCDVPAEAIDRAVAYVRDCYDSRGGFAYSPNNYVTNACTGVGILCLELAGKKSHRAPESLRAGATILKNVPTLDQQHCYYGLYYCSQAMFQLGDDDGTKYWTNYRAMLHKLLLNNQQDSGAWTGRDIEAARAGANYSTAMAVLALTVEYRFLPIYQRGQEPREKP